MKLHVTRWKDSFQEALEQLLHHKMRTFLTLLGMIFGVGAVIAMLSVGEGAEQEALKLIDSMGLRNILVESKEMDQEQLKEVREHSVGLSLRDVETGLETLPFVEDFSADKKVKTYQIFSSQGKSDASVMGVTPTHFDFARLTIKSGRFFTEEEDKYYSQVCVLGAQAARSLFPRGDAVGNTIKINHLWLRVMGVIEERHLSKNEFQGIKLGGERNSIYLPLHTALKRLKFDKLSSEIDTFRYRLRKGVNPAIAAKTLSHLLKRRHGNMDDFKIVIPAALLNQHKKTQRIFTIVMSCVAGISLLVGGIGIMNIMLATVLERTKEIGLLRAVGAKRSDIQEQFLIESFTIAAVGGLLGIVFGILLAWLIALFAGWPVAWSIWAIVLSVGVCSLVGLCFGIFPAIQASKLDPIVALHHD